MTYEKEADNKAGNKEVNNKVNNKAIAGRSVPVSAPARGKIFSVLKSDRTRLTACLAACFILPSIILMLVYISYGIAPFGDKSLLIMDMSAQYSEFFCGLKHISARSGGILFSWAKVFGSNFAGVFAYYVSSPLSILTLLCPNEYMPVGLMWLTVIKIGLCGLTFGILLNYIPFRCYS